MYAGGVRLHVVVSPAAARLLVGAVSAWVPSLREEEHSFTLSSRLNPSLQGILPGTLWWAQHTAADGWCCRQSARALVPLAAGQSPVASEQVFPNFSEK